MAWIAVATACQASKGDVFARIPVRAKRRKLGNGQGIRILAVAPYGYFVISPSAIGATVTPQADDSVSAVAEIFHASSGANHGVVPPVVGRSEEHTSEPSQIGRAHV